MAKIFMGVRLRSLRQERGMTQVALAMALGISPSYLNQLEQNQRPFTVPVLLKIHRVLGVDIQQFSEDEQARLVAQLSDAIAALPGHGGVPQIELRELAAKLPHLSQVLLAMHHRHLADQQRLQALADHLQGQMDSPSGRVAAFPAAQGVFPPDAALPDAVLQGLPVQQMPFEAVRDFFFAHRNYFDTLDRAAEALALEARQHGSNLCAWLSWRLQTRHGVHVLHAEDGQRIGVAWRRFDPRSRTLHLAPHLHASQQAFQMGTQLALLEMDGIIDQLLHSTRWQDDATRRLARIGLANYAAGALMLPYGSFLGAAQALSYDIDLLAQRFGVGFESVCHRLSTLQRSDAPGVPFFFIRVDRAGNISKRQSATHFHFSRTGGSCPLWNVYEAFARPGRILRQVASMPDGRMYLWIARSITHAGLGWGAPGKTFAIALGCDVQHAAQLVYSRGLDVRNPQAATPIGMGCKVCERKACPQRAFPYMGRALHVNENESGPIPYGGGSESTLTQDWMGLGSFPPG